MIKLHHTLWHSSVYMYMYHICSINMFDKVFSITLSLWNVQLFVPDIKSTSTVYSCVPVSFFKPFVLGVW